MVPRLRDVLALGVAALLGMVLAAGVARWELQPHQGWADDTPPPDRRPPHVVVLPPRP